MSYFMKGPNYLSSLVTITDTTPIEKIELSKRTYHCLKRAKINVVGDIYKFSDDEILKIRNLGRTSYDELVLRLENYHENRIRAFVEQGDGDTLQKEYDETLVSKVENLIKQRAMTENELFKIISEELFRDVLRHCLKELLDNNTITNVGGSYYYNYCSFEEALKSVDARIQEIISFRAYGETLEKIGRVFGVTRERVRQIEEKYFRLIKHKKFKDDEYRYIFETYFIKNDMFKDLFNVNEYTLYYLRNKYKPGTKNVFEMLNDDAISDSIKNKIKIIKLNNYVEVDGVKIPRSCNDILKYVMFNKFNDNTCKITDLQQAFKEFCEEHSLDEFKETYESDHAFEARIIRDNVRWLLISPHKEIRFYRMDDYSIKELVQKLDLKQYDGCVISTQKIFFENQSLMEEYDIRSKYELHNWIRKNIEQFEEDVQIGRMPHLEIGVVDRCKQVEAILVETGECLLADIAEVFCFKYGIDQANFISNWIDIYSKYNHNGIFYL